MSKHLSRRDFFKGSIAVAMGAVSAYALSGCAQSGGAKSAGTEAASSESSAAASGGKLKLHRGYIAAHGDSSFTQVVVATAEDGTILGASVDEYQFLAKTTAGVAGVPNSDTDFAAGMNPDMVLVSKTDNNEAYSAIMKEKAQSTQPWLTSMEAIQAFCVGKKPADLKGVSADAISGATLVDAPKYAAAVAEIAESKDIVVEGSYTGDGKDIKLGRANGAPHGKKSFGNAVSAVQEDVLVATSIDEFQFTAADTPNLIPVPSSDGKFGQNYVAGQTLMSKSVNTESYSEHMKEKAQSTTPWLESMTAIENAVAGKKIKEISIDGPDAVSGATLVDTAGYVDLAITAAESI